MVMIQDSNIPSHHDKPLRITGEPPSVAQAKEMVFDLLAEKEAQAAGFGGVQRCPLHCLICSARASWFSVPKHS